MIVFRGETKMAKQGLVGFFDILGYQNIIDKNSIDDVSLIITDVLIRLHESVIERLESPLQNIPKVVDLLRSLTNGIQAKLISDSILLVLPTQKDDLEKGPLKLLPEPQGLFIMYFIFTTYVSVLLKLTFEKGLPLRGAIDFGDFFLEGNCFAGKPIIDCYRLGSRLDFSGCVMTTSCRDRLLQLLTEKNDFNLELSDFGYDYHCPCKNQSYEPLFLIRWLYNTVLQITDLRQYVYEAFKEHNKDIGVGVYDKMVNTELTLRFIKMNKQKAVVDVSRKAIEQPCESKRASEKDEQGNVSN